MKSNITFSVLTCCYKYLQRLRIFLRALAVQDTNRAAYEVVIADPGSPDGLKEYLDTVKRAVPTMNIVRVSVPGEKRRNRGWMIQRAFECSSGAFVMSADCDIVVPPHFITRMAQEAFADSGRVLGVYRNLLPPELTSRILAGMVDPLACFGDILSVDYQEEDGHRGVLGYCQVAWRSAWEKTGYPEEFDHIATSDVEFVRRLQAQQGITPYMVPDLRVLHLWHPRNWEGTEEFL